MSGTLPPAALLDQAVAAVSRFGKSATAKLRGGGGPEDQLRAPLERLFNDIATAHGLSITMVGETSLTTLGVRPDYAVDVAGARVGYVELKAPGRGVPGAWTPNKHEKTQWEKLRLLPNVLYTDGEQWALYRDGNLVGQIARLNGDIRKAGEKLVPADGEFARVLSDFLLWTPNPPRNIRQLVRAVAGLCKLLRTEVTETIGREQRGEEKTKVFTDLVVDWRKLLFPGLTREEFADAYAQTVTFALLLARVEGITFEHRSLGQIAAQLGKSHSLMGKALAVLTHETVEGRSIVVETLKRVIGAVDWDKISDGSADSYLHLYESFLEIYDPDLRKQSGSYYTPNEVVAFMVRFTEDILRDRFGLVDGFADDGVVVVDPAMGTGTYLLNIVDRVAHTVEQDEGPGAVPGRLRNLFGRLIGMERQAGPYAVAELRLNQALKAHYKAEIAEADQRLYVADTLDSPYENTALDLGSLYEPIIRSRREANKVKRDTPVQVVIGNPPYRERAKGMGGWIEQGAINSGQPVPLNAFKAHGLGRYAYVLSNLYVYFWRWATWKVFDAHPTDRPGVVAFITTSGYTTGPGFAGMREYLRRTADEGWIIDLSPEGHQPEVSTRVFPGVQQPLCIGIFVRYGQGDPTTPATVHYTTVTGHRKDKFTQLANLKLTDQGVWTSTSTNWQDRLQPLGGARWLTYPLLGDLMPWQAPGVKPNRTWVYAPSPGILRARWDRLTRAPEQDKPTLFKESDARKVDSIVQPLPGMPPHESVIRDERSPCPTPVRIAYRSFDRQWVIPDARVQERARPELWRVAGAIQVFAVEQHAHAIHAGPGLVFANLIPDMHYINGRGGRVLPLYRDTAGNAVNLAPGLIRHMSAMLGIAISADDVLSYIAAVTAHSGYTARFRDELRTPGVRVPLTADANLWRQAVDTGRRVIWLHTYGERCVDPAKGRPQGPPKPPASEQPKVRIAIPGTVEGMPDQIDYDPSSQTLLIGDGQISPIRPEVWSYEVSGMKIIRKWFGYRKKSPAGRASSPLDAVHSETWPAAFTTELLQLLNVLTLCVDLEPAQHDLLTRICAFPLITVQDLEEAHVLPVPKASRIAPTSTAMDAPTLPY